MMLPGSAEVCSNGRIELLHLILGTNPSGIIVQEYGSNWVVTGTVLMAIAV